MELVLASSGRGTLWTVPASHLASKEVEVGQLAPVRQSKDRYYSFRPFQHSGNNLITYFFNQTEEIQQDILCTSILNF